MSKFKGFTSVELRRPKRSTFNLSHEKRLSTRLGKLTPVLITETLPNDTFNGSTEVLLKLAPMIAPVFHRMNLYVHFFFVPMRLLWEEWEKFITGGRSGEAINTPPIPPYVGINQALLDGKGYLDQGSLADYLGVPPIQDASIDFVDRTIDLAPFLGYYKCWYDYYRDRNYEADNELLPMASGSQAHADAVEMLKMRVRAWEHDYFTSALPFTQRGTEVLMPLQGSGQVTYSPASELYAADGSVMIPGDLTNVDVGAQDRMESTGNPGVNLRVENIAGVDITNSEVSINDLRRAVRLQEWMERNALAGSRYNESIMAHFGRKTSDSRLQRAEYIGGGKAVIQISEINTTSYSPDADDVIIPPGNPAGRGSTYANTNHFSYNCEEHGFVIGILSCLPTSAYMQGLPRMFQKRNSFLDYPWPSFAHLGEQEVYDIEVYMDGTSMPVDRAASPVFGYQSRYADWKFIGSSSHGDFRNELDYWHLTRKFSAPPLLGSQFVYFEDALQDRIFNVSGVDTMWLYVYNKLYVKRALPYFGTPKL